MKLSLWVAGILLTTTCVLMFVLVLDAKAFRDQSLAVLNSFLAYPIVAYSIFLFYQVFPLCVALCSKWLGRAVVRFAEPSVVILRDQFMKSTHYLRGGLLFCWVKKTRRREQPQRRCRAHTDRRVRLPGEEVRSWRAPHCCL